MILMEVLNFCEGKTSWNHDSYAGLQHLQKQVLTPVIHFLAQAAGAAEYTHCISAEKLDSPRTIVLDMTINNLMVRLQ